MADRPGVLAPPPLIYGVCFLIGWLTHRWLPPIVIPMWIGFALIAVGLAIAMWAIVLMHYAGTHVDPYAPTTAIVTRGPYRVSRNPIYIALTLVYAGFALALQFTTALLLLPVALVILTRGVIAREERYLAAKFGDAYRDYCSRVRRWL